MSDETEVEIHEHNGREYRLGLIPTPPERRLLCADFPFEPIPEKDWRPVNRRKLFRSMKTMNNQRSTSGCVGFSTACGGSKARFLSGQPFVHLSGPFIYSLVNGGRDQGAMIIDALEAFLKYGCCSTDSLPLDSGKRNIYRSASKQFDGEAKRRLLEIGFKVDNAAQAMTVLQRGGILEFGVKVGNRFSSLDSEGIAGFDSGYANHAVHGDGCYLSPKRGWCIDSENTWGYEWGDDGRFRFTVDDLDRVGYQECFGMFGFIDDPEDDFVIPTPAE